MATSEDAGRVDEELVRALSPERKLAIMSGLIRQAHNLKASWIRASRPELSEDEVREVVREQVAGGSP